MNTDEGSEHIEWRSQLQRAHDRVAELARQDPDIVELESVMRQLEYLMALADGSETDDSRLEELTMGVFAMKNLADIFPRNLQSELCEISEVVRLDLRRQGRRMRYS